MQVRRIGNSKLHIGVSEGVNNFVCLCVSPAIDWQSVQGVPRFSPYDCWDRLQPPVTLNRTNGFRKWMDGWLDE
ncbi:hypothetical protein LDENG_00148760 [Lucifuga dentata]|nr:hypothetical protein LDENG_00148760 [Lucifuga dentata]